MELAAIVHTMEQRDCYALEPGRFLFRLRAKQGDLQEVSLVYQEKYIERKEKDTRCICEMRKVSSDGIHDYFEVEIESDFVCIRYYFRLKDDAGRVLYYGNYGFFSDWLEDIDDMFDCPQNMREEERFAPPDWMKNKVIYQIYPSRFASSKPVQEEIWYQKPIDSQTKLQGDLQGIREKLPYLKSLGVEVIYMTPLFQSISQHKYNTKNYYEIDSSFGSKEDLEALVETAHALGIYVILDGVFHHTGTDFFAFQDLLEKQEHSAYKEWYYVKQFPVSVKKNCNYKTFNYFSSMPKLRVTNPEVEKYFVDVATYWIKECDIDGWRLDVGDEVPHSFWRAFRKAVKKVKPQAAIIGEVWHCAPDFLEGDQWDSVMNYPFYFAVKKYVALEEISTEEFWNQMGFLRGRYQQKQLPLLWNFIDNHDTERFLYSCKEAEEKLKFAVGLQMFLVGCPVIYYGDECGLTGGPDPDCRRGMLWDVARQNQRILQYYKQCIKVRKQYGEMLEAHVIEQVLEGKDTMHLICQSETSVFHLFFHGGKEVVSLLEWVESYDLLSEQVWNGNLQPYQIVIVRV